jgi:hypothetical protein
VALADLGGEIATMRGTTEAFSFPTMRRLFRYLGETDALVELTELAARAFVESANVSGDASAFIAAQSNKHGIRVNLSEFAHLSRHLGRSSIVTVYQSAERFLHEFRKEHSTLYSSRPWTGDADDVDPMTVTLRNVATSSLEAETRVGTDLLSRFQYYRVVRNWVVHTKESDDSKPQAMFEKLVPYSAVHEAQLDSVKAPNPPGHLGFDDFILFSRVTKLIAERLCEIATPPLEHWEHAFTLARFKHLSTNSTRMRNAVMGRLRTEYGMDTPTAQWIADELCGSLAQR